MRLKIKNELRESDYKELIECLKDVPNISIELFHGLDLDFVALSSVLVAVEGSGYKISTQISFNEPIGLEVYGDLNLDAEMRSTLLVNRRNFRLSKIVMDAADFNKDLNITLKTIERVVNHVSNKFGEMVEQTFAINSELLNKQLYATLKREELEKRGEVPRLFGTIHASGLKDAKERAGNFVPVYLERDKTYLYEDKKVFMLLPRDFAMKLLKLEGATMMGADQFSGEEKEALKKFSIRQYVKERKVAGKIYYSDLDETTRRLLLMGMKKA